MKTKKLINMKKKYYKAILVFMYGSIWRENKDCLYGYAKSINNIINNSGAITQKLSVIEVISSYGWTQTIFGTYTVQ